MSLHNRYIGTCLCVCTFRSATQGLRRGNTVHLREQHACQKLCEFYIVFVSNLYPIVTHSQCICTIRLWKSFNVFRDDKKLHIIHIRDFRYLSMMKVMPYFEQFIDLVSRNLGHRSMNIFILVLHLEHFHMLHRFDCHWHLHLTAGKCSKPHT